MKKTWKSENKLTQRARVKDNLTRIVFFGFQATLALFILGGICFADVDTSKAVIHHTASHDVSADTINDWHKERGWDGIGYHFVIRQNGQVETGRSLKKYGAHALGRNNYIGIVLTGYDNFTQAQLNSLVNLLKQLGVKNIERHHEECPGQGLDVESIQKEL